MASVQTRQPATKRFPLPNHIWKLGLQAGALVVLAYLQYRNYLGLRGPVTCAELEQYTGLRQTAAKRQFRTLTEHGLITEGGCPTPRLNCEKRFFTLPYEAFHLGLSSGAVAVYAFLRAPQHTPVHPQPAVDRAPCGYERQHGAKVCDRTGGTGTGFHRADNSLEW